MYNVYLSIELLLLAMKCVGVMLIIGSILYFILKKPFDKNKPVTWKKLITMTFGVSLVNVGFVITFGKVAFALTPITLFVVLALWFMKKIPSWKVGHVLSFALSFVVFSVGAFIVIAGFFFHVAVEGGI